MKKASKTGPTTSQDCRCQRSACSKNYCRCYNANRMCGASCKCLGESKTITYVFQNGANKILWLSSTGCKNVPPGTRPAPAPVKADTDTRQKCFNDEIACSITRVLMAKAFQLQSEVVHSLVDIEREVLVEFNNCILEVAQHAQAETWFTWQCII